MVAFSCPYILGRQIEGHNSNNAGRDFLFDKGAKGARGVAEKKQAAALYSHKFGPQVAGILKIREAVKDASQCTPEAVKLLFQLHLGEFGPVPPEELAVVVACVVAHAGRLLYKKEDGAQRFKVNRESALQRCQQYKEANKDAIAATQRAYHAVRLPAVPCRDDECAVGVPAANHFAAKVCCCAASIGTHTAPSTGAAAASRPGLRYVLWIRARQGGRGACCWPLLPSAAILQVGR